FCVIWECVCCCVCVSGVKCVCVCGTQVRGVCVCVCVCVYVCVCDLGEMRMIMCVCESSFIQAWSPPPAETRTHFTHPLPDEVSVGMYRPPEGCHLPPPEVSAARQYSIRPVREPLTPY